ncbi:hypothetical protein E4J89_08315 [Arthrobacter sp. CAU 1506]|uniref:hypothetical protein n=1 Tax=Arthrobacter sp. CAU 1506 TaxID=2560052 RepID=UPI0010AD7139|nr:hypothetical protein [Arthrobacter sp. CAU 1506]TJY70159.1 hypothetical protein E4J89_08315 [Arthrobacter sp. CAU 1506]
MQALLKIAAGGLVMAVTLTSCSSASPASHPTTPVPAASSPAASHVPNAPAEVPAAPDPADGQGATAAPSPTPPSASADAKEGSEANKSADQWGRYGDQADACAAVAANVASLLLVPLGFMTGVEDSDLESLQEELDDFSRDVPAQLTDDLDRVEQLLEQAAPDHDVDVTAFAEALEPVQEWLSEHCGD